MFQLGFEYEVALSVDILTQFDEWMQLMQVEDVFPLRVALDAN